MAKPMAGCYLACRIARSAFALNEDTLAILESGVNPEYDSKLLVLVRMLLEAMHSADLAHCRTRAGMSWS